MVTSSRYASVIFYVIYLEFLRREVFSMSAKETVYKVAYKLGLEAYSVRGSRKFSIQAN